MEQMVPCFYFKLQEALTKKVAKYRQKKQPGVLLMDDFQKLARSCSADPLDEDEIIQVKFLWRKGECLA